MASHIARHVKQTVIASYLEKWQQPVTHKPDPAVKHMDEVEWAVYKIAPDGSKVRHSEGAQTVFGLTRARRVAKELGAEWVVLHAEGGTPPGQE